MGGVIEGKVSLLHLIKSFDKHHAQILSFIRLVVFLDASLLNQEKNFKNCTVSYSILISE